MKHLYSDFLKDKKVHSLNEAFYKRLLKTVTRSQPTPYFQKVYRGGFTGTAKRVAALARYKGLWCRSC